MSKKNTANTKATDVVATPTTPDLEALKLAQAEATAIAKHGDKIVVGSAERDPASNKVTVLINTRGVDGEYDGNTRRVATSDVHQVHHTPEVKKVLDRDRARAKRPTKLGKVETALAKQGLSLEELLA
jgi:hypothetical protein